MAKTPRRKGGLTAATKAAASVASKDEASELAEAKPVTLWLPTKMVHMLQLAAAHRAIRVGGRVSVSALVRDLIERHEDELEGG